MILLQLFWEYFKIGLFAVGGGMATVPFLYDLSDSTGWFTHAQLADMLAVSESTPGPIGINMATYVGYTTAGLSGAVVATLGVILPSVILALLIAGALLKFRRNRYVEAVFYGLRPASAALIGAAAVTVMTIALLQLDRFQSTGVFTDLFNWKACLLALGVLICSNWIKATKKWHPIVFIVISAVLGAVFGFSGT